MTHWFTEIDMTVLATLWRDTRQHQSEQACGSDEWRKKMLLMRTLYKQGYSYGFNWRLPCGKKLKVFVQCWTGAELTLVWLVDWGKISCFLEFSRNNANYNSNAAWHEAELFEWILVWIVQSWFRYIVLYKPNSQNKRIFLWYEYAYSAFKVWFQIFSANVCWPCFPNTNQI